MARVLRGIVLAAGVLAAGLWIAPALLLPGVVARLLASDGVEYEFDGVRPALPWGMTAAKVVVARADGTVEFTEVSARVRSSGVRVEGSVGAGTLLLSTRELTLRGALIRAQALPLEAFAAVLPGALGLHGTVDGVYRFEERDSLEATVRRGAVALRSPLQMEIPFMQLVVTAAREDDGGWRVGYADLRGPPLSGSAQGRISADGALELDIEISRLEEPALSAFTMAGLPTGPLPIAAELRGTLEQPLFVPLAAHAR